jgi:Tfp pilus assembly protein PilV
MMNSAVNVLISSTAQGLNTNRNDRSRAGGKRCDASESADGAARGFILLEVLVSIVFMAAILLMSLNFMVAGIRGNSRGKEMSAASYLAQEMLEEMRLVDFNDLLDFDGYTTGGSLPGGQPAADICEDWEDGVTTELPSGHGEIDVQVTGSLARISVLVGWLDGVNKDRQVRFETMIADRS